jgi:hypothetical protein
LALIDTISEQNDKENIESYKSCQVWLEGYNSPSTKKSYKVHLLLFCRYHNTNPDSLIGLKPEQIKTMVLDYIIHLKKVAKPSSGKARRGELSVNSVTRILKWLPPFRDGLKFTYFDLGILDILIPGKTEITAKMLEKMKKFGCIYQEMGHVDFPDDPGFTVVSFRRYHAPPLENGGKSDKKVLKKMKSRRTETGHVPQESVRRGSAVSSDHGQGDDISQ